MNRRTVFLIISACVALGVCGGIGAYKAVEVVRGLQKRGHDVVALMTHAATRFVGPLTFEAITKRPAVVGDNAIAVRSLVNMCLTFDHRVLDGHLAGAFLQDVKRRMESDWNSEL